MGYYLKKKVEGEKFELDVIPVIDLYKFDPWQLPGIDYPNLSKTHKDPSITIFSFCHREIVSSRERYEMVLLLPQR